MISFLISNIFVDVDVDAAWNGRAVVSSIDDMKQTLKNRSISQEMSERWFNTGMKCIKKKQKALRCQIMYSPALAKSSKKGNRGFLIKWNRSIVILRSVNLCCLF